MPRMYVYPYKATSEGARDLAKELNAGLIGVDVGSVLPSPNNVIINWGAGDVGDSIFGCKTYNRPSSVCLAINKKHTFEALNQINKPPFTTSREIAARWIQEGSRVCARQRLEGKDGAGLTIHNSVNTLPNAKLYTKFIPAIDEYRVNVVNGKTVGVQKKVPNATNYNQDIKTTSGGYGFHLLSEHEIPIRIRPIARHALVALGLDYGGVDIIRGRDGHVYVLEINTAPHLTPAMARAYANEIRRMVNGL